MISETLTPQDIMHMETHIEDNAQPLILTILVVSIVVAYVSTALRLLARWKKRVQLSYDDYLIILGLILVTGTVVTAYFMVAYGFGRHIILVTNIKSLMQTGIALEVLYNFSLPPIKVSVLCLYHRIFPSRTLYKLSIALGFLICTYSTIPAIFAVIFCLPSNNDMESHPTKCINLNLFVIISASLNVVIDAILLTTPVPLVWRLHLSRSQRLGLITTFGLGGIVTGISVGRAVLAAQPSTADFSWSEVGVSTISIVEICMAVLSACLPTYRPLLRPRVSKEGTGNPEYPGGLSSRSGGWSTKGETPELVGQDHALKLELGRKDWIRLSSMDGPQIESCSSKLEAE